MEDTHKAGSNPIGLKLKDKKGGNMDEWPEELRVREYPKTLEAVNL